jgi:hypothetical protein
MEKIAIMIGLMVAFKKTKLMVAFKKTKRRKYSENNNKLQSL